VGDINSLLKKILGQLKQEHRQIEKRNKKSDSYNAVYTPISEKYQVELAAIASICCALGRQDEYQYLCRKGTDISDHQWLRGHEETHVIPTHAREGVVKIGSPSTSCLSQPCLFLLLCPALSLG